ncbi:hypothetical protein K439DRAFT_1620296 [Ramaria rubella]|nr:hypothetical protein K439DRAFT_1620296 [Ramaria rubella]
MVNAHTIIHEANVKCLTNGIQTQEQLDRLVAQLNAIGAAQADTLNPELSIRNPPVPQQKGCPRTARLTSAIEGPRHSGYGSKRPYPGAPPLQSQPSPLESNLVRDEFTSLSVPL